jgi:uncharacterized protein YndB with AHSA1/START domain
MQTHERAIEIGADAALVFTWLTEPDKLSQWLGGFVSSEPIAGAGHERGAKARVTIEENGRARVMTSEVLDVEPGKRLTVAVNGEGIATKSAYRLEPSGAGVLLTHRMDAEFSGLLALMAPFFRGLVARKMESDLARLKAAVEALG